MQLIRVTELTADIVQLIGESQQYQHSIYPAESIHQIDLDQFLADDMVFFAAYDAQTAVAIGGFKLIQGDDDYAEIKNLFVASDARGKGYATQLMQLLETEMLKHGLQTARLETGVNQPESVALYERLGYRTRGPFGSYKLDPLSLFMEKTLNTSS